MYTLALCGLLCWITPGVLLLIAWVYHVVTRRRVMTSESDEVRLTGYCEVDAFTSPIRFVGHVHCTCGELGTIMVPEWAISSRESIGTIKACRRCGARHTETVVTLVTEAFVQFRHKQRQYSESN